MYRCEIIKKYKQGVDVVLSPDRRAPGGEGFVIPSGNESDLDGQLKPSGEWQPVPRVTIDTLVKLETHRPGRAPSVIKYVYVAQENIKKEDLPPDIIEVLPRGAIVILSLKNSDPRVQEIAERLLGKGRGDTVGLAGDVKAIIKDIACYVEADN